MCISSEDLVASQWLHMHSLILLFFSNLVLEGEERIGMLNTVHFTVSLSFPSDVGAQVYYV